MRTPFLPVFVITLATGVMANMHYRHHHEPLHELETVLNLDDDSFDTALASWNRMDEFKSAIWLLWFHTSSDTTHIDGPMPSTSDGVHVASFAMRRSSRTMRRLGVQIIPSFACLNYSRQKLYRYPEPFKEGGYKWESLIEYCRNPPDSAVGYDIPQPESIWVRWERQLYRNRPLQLTVIILLVVGMGSLVGWVLVRLMPPTDPTYARVGTKED